MGVIIFGILCVLTFAITWIMRRAYFNIIYEALGEAVLSGVRTKHVPFKNRIITGTETGV